VPEVQDVELVNPPQNLTVASCLEQESVQTLYENWLNQFAEPWTGGCNLQIVNNAPELAPDACGGSVLVTWTATSQFTVASTANATFTVSPAPELSVSCPGSITIAGTCGDQSTINAAFNDWINKFTATGGCNTVTTDLSQFTAPSACDGGTVVLTFEAWDDCGQYASCTATFKVIPPTYTVTFIVLNALGEPITDAQITLDGQANIAGNYVFEGINAGVYPFTAARDTYHTYMDHVAVDHQDVTRTIIMTLEADVPADLELAKDEHVTVDDEECFDAYRTMTVAGHGYFFTVLNGGHATLIAGESIRLLPGTVVQPGGSLHAFISKEEFCGIPVAEPLDDIITAIQSPDAERKGDFFKVFPNPTTGEFTIQLTESTGAENVRIEIYSMMGNMVIAEEFTRETEYSMSLSGQQPGMYFVRVYIGDRVGIERIIKR